MFEKINVLLIVVPHSSLFAGIFYHKLELFCVLCETPELELDGHFNSVAYVACNLNPAGTSLCHFICPAYAPAFTPR